MKLALTSTLAAVTASFVMTLGGGSVAHAADPIISVDGSSTVYPITEAVAEEFQGMKKGKVKVTVGVSGTGGGFKKFCRGETDVQDASRPIQASEMEACKKAGVKYIELPIAFDAIAVVVNPKNTTIDKLSVEDLKKIWAPEAQGKLMKWSDVNPKWPGDKLKLFGAGADSGTFDYFTEAIVGKAKSSRGDYTASEDDNTLVQGISSDKGALGYIPYSYYEANKSKLKLVTIDGGDKAPKKGGVAPSRETVENGTYYPLSRPLFIYVSEAALKRPEVKEFAQFYLEKGQEFVTSVKEIPLPAKAYKTALEHLNKGKLGTVFGGKSEVGLKIDELLKREGTM